MKIIRLALLLTALTVMMTACNDDDPAPYMELSQKQIDLKADGGDFALTVNSNVKYVVNHACEWLRITNSTTLGDATTLDISVEPNTDLEGRSARIKFIGENVTPKAFEIRQSGYIPTGVSATSLKAESGDTSVEFDVLGEGAWSAISSNPDYVRTAYSKGCTGRRVLYGHVLRNAMMPVVTFLGMIIAEIVAGIELLRIAPAQGGNLAYADVYQVLLNARPHAGDFPQFAHLPPPPLLT